MVRGPPPGLSSWSIIGWWSLCISFKDRATVDEIYWCPISDELQWLDKRWEGTKLVVLSPAVRWHCLFLPAGESATGPSRTFKAGWLRLREGILQWQPVSYILWLQVVRGTRNIGGSTVPSNQGRRLGVCCYTLYPHYRYRPWWRHNMETLALCEGNPSITIGQYNA